MMIPDDVRGELKQFAKDQRLLPRFRSAMVNAEQLEETLSEDVMMSLVDDVLSEYNTWSPSADMVSVFPTLPTNSTPSFCDTAMCLTS